VSAYLGPAIDGRSPSKEDQIMKTALTSSPAVPRNRRTALLAWAFLAIVTSTAAVEASEPGIACVQNQLNALGFDAGSADGSIGPNTRTAAEEYRRWMSGGAGGDGWSQPALTALNGEQWCRQIAVDHPETAEYQPVAIDQSYTVTASKGLVATFSLPAEGRISDVHLFFAFKTECEGDLWAMLTSPTGTKVVVMDRGEHRCSGTPTDFDSNNEELGRFFKGGRADGKWTFEFKDLNSNFEQGQLEEVRLEWWVTANGKTTKHTASLDGLPAFIPNPN
jgi:subtilisin-like proprotein convertase family protein